MGVHSTYSRVPQRSLVAILWLATLYGAWLSGTTASRDNPPDSAKARRLSAAASPSAQHPGDQATSASSKTPSPADPAVLASRLRALLLQPPGPQRERQILFLFEEWAAVDPVEALQKTGDLAGRSLRIASRSRILQRWGQKDPAAAWTFARANASGDLPEYRETDVLTGAGQCEIHTALAFLEACGTDKPGYRQIYGVVSKLFDAGNANTLLPWAESLPPGRLRETSVGEIVERMARYDPAAAKAWMEKLFPGESKAQQPWILLARSWAGVDPAAALEWVGSLPSGRDTAQIYNCVIRDWLIQEPGPAAEWFAAQPPKPDLDPALEFYVQRATLLNPAETMPWAQSVTNPELRQHLIARVASDWRATDRPALEAWLASADLPSDLKSRILNPPPLTPNL